MQHKPRRWLWLLIPLTPIAILGAAWAMLAWDEGPPLWWVLRGSRIEKVVVHWGKQQVTIIDPDEVQLYYQSIRSGSNPLPYPTRCLADVHPENWSVTLIRSNQSPFQVQVGIDGCRTFYVPEVGSTYGSAQLIRLIEKRFKRPL